MMPSETRRSRPARPAVEGLEGRQLLNARFDYTTASGARVTITLIAAGNLDGTKVGPDGALDLVYSGTLQNTLIYGKVSGGRGGTVALGSIRDAASAPGDFSGAGSEKVGVVNLRPFTLVSGGSINLTAGVSRLVLDSADANSQIHLGQPPAITVSSTATGTSPSTGVIGGTVGSSNTTSSTTGLTQSGPSSVGGLNVTSAGSSVAATSGTTGAFSGSINGTTGTGTGSTTTGTTTTTTSSSGGVSSTTSSGTANSTSGNTTSTGTVSSTVTSSTGVGGGSSGSTGSTTFFAGTDVIIHHVRGSAAAGLGDPQVFGYDPTAGTLIRFDAKTGVPLQTIAVAAAAPGASVAGVSLGRDGGRLVALVGIGSTVSAYDALNGTFVGSFTTGSLAANGLTTVTGLGSTDTRTVVSDANAGALGLLQVIDVTKSLATGQAVAMGSPYTPLQQFQLSGGLTGLSGSDGIYASGAAHFDTFQPNNIQLGLLGLNATTSTLVESGRAALPNAKAPGGVNAPAGPLANQGLGSVDQDLAQVTGLGNGGNVVSFFSASTLAYDGTVTLFDPNLLAGLSESFRPSLAGSVLVDSRGNIRSFQADDVNGLVLNAAGEAQRIIIGRATNSTLVARPINHLGIGQRTNVEALSTPRVGRQTRGGVTVVFGMKQVGPLTLPDRTR